MLILWGQRKQRRESARRSDKTGVWLISPLSLQSFCTDQKSIKGEFHRELFKQCNISSEIIANSSAFVAQVWITKRAISFGNFLRGSVTPGTVCLVQAVQLLLEKACLLSPLTSRQRNKAEGMGFVMGWQPCWVIAQKEMQTEETRGWILPREWNRDCEMNRFVLFSHSFSSCLPCCLAQASASCCTLAQWPCFCHLQALSWVPGYVPLIWAPQCWDRKASRHLDSSWCQLWTQHSFLRAWNAEQQGLLCSTANSPSQPFVLPGICPFQDPSATWCIFPYSTWLLIPIWLSLVLQRLVEARFGGRGNICYKCDILGVGVGDELWDAQGPLQIFSQTWCRVFFMSRRMTAFLAWVGAACEDSPFPCGLHLSLLTPSQLQQHNCSPLLTLTGSQLDLD